MTPGAAIQVKERPGLKIKAITLWEPWATAMSLGLKKIETRHWKTDYRGPLAIHAAQRLIDPPEKLSPELVAAIRANDFVDKCAYGNVVCIVDLYDVQRTDFIVKMLSRGGTFADPEFIWGNYKPCRYGWMTRRRVVLEPTIPSTGHQGLWTWEVPAEYEQCVNGMIAEAMIS